MKKGFIVGKFAPLTTGHVHFINEARKHCHELLVLLSFDNKWLQQQPKHFHNVLTLENRLRWLDNTFGCHQDIIVDYVDESHIQPAPHGWGEFSELVRDKIKHHFDIEHCHYTFTSEPSYDEGFKTHFPKTEHVLIDPERKRLPITATMVRNDPDTYWSYLPEAVRVDFQHLRLLF